VALPCLRLKKVIFAMAGFEEGVTSLKRGLRVSLFSLARTVTPLHRDVVLLNALGKETRSQAHLRCDALLASSGGPRLMETVAVGELWRKEFMKRVTSSRNFCDLKTLAINKAQLNLEVVKYFDYLFLEQPSVDAGTKSLASVRHDRPMALRSGRSGRLPRV
jgi:hypothetical protein